MRHIEGLNPLTLAHQTWRLELKLKLCVAVRGWSYSL